MDDDIIDSMDVAAFTPGQVIFREGDPADALYVVLSGRVKITSDRKGSTVLIATVDDDQMFGDLALIENGPRTATATAEEATECLVMTIKDFRMRLDELDPFMKAVFETISRRLRRTTTLFAVNAAKEPIEDVLV